MIRIALIALCCGGCLNAGPLAGFTEPGIRYSKNWFGVTIEATSDVTEGQLDLVRNGETGEMELHVQGGSNASDPTRSQGERYAISGVAEVQGRIIEGYTQLGVEFIKFASVTMEQMPGILSALNPPKPPEPPTIPGQPPPWWPEGAPWPPVGLVPGGTP